MTEFQRNIDNSEPYLSNSFPCKNVDTFLLGVLVRFRLQYKDKIDYWF